MPTKKSKISWTSTTEYYGYTEDSWCWEVVKEDSRYHLYRGSDHDTDYGNYSTLEKAKKVAELIEQG